MKQRQPIPTETLKDILSRRKDDPEILALLWEIWRLRRAVVKAHQLAASAPRHDVTFKLLADQTLRMLENEPAVLEHLTWKRGTIKPEE